MIDQIEHYAARPLFDKTNLSGFYDFEIEWAPDDLAAAGPDGPVPDPGGLSIFTALQKELGLKLEPGTAPFDTVVIDRAEKPAEN